MDKYSIRNALTWIRKNVVFIGLALILVPLLLLMLSMAGLFIDNPFTSNTTDIEMVQGGSLSPCPGKTVKQMVNSFIASPSWKAGIGNNDQRLVNVIGDVNYAEKPIKAELQFLIDKSGKSFTYDYGLEFNGIPQNRLMASEFLTKMCGGENSQVSEDRTQPPVSAESNNNQVLGRDEFKQLVIGKTKDEIISLIGKPDSTNELAGYESWDYSAKTRDTISGKVDSIETITFENNIADGVNFMSI